MAEQKSWQRPLRIRMSIWMFLSTLSFGLGTLRGLEWIPSSFAGVCLCLELTFLLAALAAMVYILLGNTEYVSSGITMQNNGLLQSPSAPPVCAPAPDSNQPSSKKLNRTMSKGNF